MDGNPRAKPKVSTSVMTINEQREDSLMRNLPKEHKLHIRQMYLSLSKSVSCYLPHHLCYTGEFGKYVFYFNSLLRLKESNQFGKHVHSKSSDSVFR